MWDRSRFSLKIIKKKKKAHPQQLLSHSISGMHTHGERGDGVLFDHPDISSLSHSSPLCQPTENTEPQKSFQQQPQTKPYPVVSGNIRYTPVHVHNPNTHKDSDSGLSHRFLLRSSTNTDPHTQNTRKPGQTHKHGALSSAETRPEPHGKTCTLTRIYKNNKRRRNRKRTRYRVTNRYGVF